MDLTGERKLVTVLFADISGFTALSGKLDPEQVRDIINACFNTLVPVIEKYGGMVDKFVGDEVMALFGAPVAHENDAERALRAALEMMPALASFNARYGTDLGMHIGINSGLVVAGGLGSEGRQQYSVMGDTVNLASRLEDASENGQILVGPHTHYLTSPMFDFETLPPVLVKGKADPVPVYSLIGLKSSPKPGRGFAGQSPFIGRETEFGQLRAALQNLESGNGRVITVVGEPGLGKSRLIHELRQFADTYMPHVQWAEGHTQSYTEGISFWVARSILDSLVGSNMEMSPAEAGEVLRKYVSELPGLNVPEVFPYLARLREISLDKETEMNIRQVLPEALQGRMKMAFFELVRAIGKEKPLVLIWEDLHWADPSSLSLLEMLLPLTQEAPVLMVLLFRPNEEQIEDWHQRIRTTVGELPANVIELTPLTVSDSKLLIEKLHNIGNISETTYRVILGRAEGNPFFLEELLNSLLESGHLSETADHVIAPGISENLKVPDTLQGIIASRIDRLSPEEKLTLQAASVIGRVFQQSVLDKLLAREHIDVDLDTALESLQKKKLIHRHGASDYIFKHAVTLEVTYGSLLISRRKNLHRAAGEMIESMFSDQLAELAPTLAHHYGRADAGAKAIYYLRQAADRARITFSNTEAIAYYQAALDQADKILPVTTDNTALQRQTIQLYEGLGDVHTLTGQHDEARVAYGKALSLVPVDDRIWRSRLYRNIGTTWIAQRQPADAMKVYDLASAELGVLPADPDPRMLEESLEVGLVRMDACYFSYSIAQMQALAKDIAPTIGQYGTSVQRAKYYSNLSKLELLIHRYRITDENMSYVRAALVSSQEANQTRLIGMTLFQVGFCRLWRDDFTGAETDLQAALDLAEHIGDRELILTILSWLTVTYRRNGRLEKVRIFANRSLEVATVTKISIYIGIARANMAWVNLRDGALSDAQTNARIALEFFGHKPLRTFVKWLALIPLSELAMKSGDEIEIIDFLRSLLDPSQMHLSPELEDIFTQALRAWDDRKPGQARTLLLQGLELAKKTGWG